MLQNNDHPFPYQNEEKSLIRYAPVNGLQVRVLNLAYL